MRGAPYPRSSGPTVEGRPIEGRPIEELPIDEPPIDPRPADSPDLTGSEDDRGGMDENLCQPPLLPFARPDVAAPELPGRYAVPELADPPKSLPATLSEVGLERWNPVFEREPALLLELVFPGRESSRPFPIDLPFATADVLPRLALWAEKKC